MYKKMSKTTHLFIKCLEYQYAKAFIDEGAIRFAMPSEWKPDGTSRGDNLEGVYASFYKSKEVTSYRAYCMYGVNR